jgi:hypothetical protein
MKTKVLLFLAFICLPAIFMAQNTIHVPGDQPTIQAGIDAALDGDLVLVDQGTYYENILYKGKAITVASNYINTKDSADMYNTIIDGSQPLNPDSASVVYFNHNEDSLSVILGFTIRGGSGTKLSYGVYGGGIICMGAEPSIIHNRIINNECIDNGAYASGGGIYMLQCFNTIPVIKENYIAENACYKNTEGDGIAYGGGISIESGNICLVEDNIFKANHCYNEIVGEYSLGGGMYADYVIILIKNNHFIDNYTENTNLTTVWGPCIELYGIKDGSIISGNKFEENYYLTNMTRGGGLSVYGNYGEVWVENNIFENNMAGYGSGLAVEKGGAVFICNNIFMGNHADLSRGAVYVRELSEGDGLVEGFAGRLDQENNSDISQKGDGALVMMNNTFIDNTTPNSYATSFYSEQLTIPTILFNNIFKSNEGTFGSEVNTYSSIAGVYVFNNVLDTVNHLTCTGDWIGEKNINVDPALWDDSCHLNCYMPSPCIDAGIGELEIEGVTYYAPGFDFEGEARPLDQGYDIGADETMICVFINENKTGDHTPIIGVFPNPFTDHTYFEIELLQSEYISFKVYNNFGQLEGIIAEGFKQEGKHLVNWNAISVPSGLYYYRLKLGNDVLTGKVIKR